MLWTPTRRRLSHGAMALITAYLALVVAIAIWQRDLIYHPWSGRVPPPVAFTAVSLPVAAGEAIAWYRPAAQGRETIAFFDGNGGALVGAVPFTRGLAAAGYGLLLVSYPGYDGNPGSPTEAGLYDTGRSALHWLDQHGIAKPVLFGYSLGTGVATQMALEHPAKTLILLSPFASMTRMARLDVPLVPVGLLLLDRYDSIAKIGRIHVPVLVIHGDADRVIPIAEGRALFTAAQPPKRFVTRPGGGHVQDMAAIVPEIVAFLADGK